MKDKKTEIKNSFNEKDNEELLQVYEQNDIETSDDSNELDEVFDNDIENAVEDFQVITNKQKNKTKKTKNNQQKFNFSKVKTLFTKKDKKQIKAELNEKLNLKESYSNTMDKVVESKVFNMKSLGAKLVFSITLCTAVLVTVIIFVLSFFMGGLVKKTYTAECEISMKAIEQQLDNFRVDSIKYADSLATDPVFTAAVVTGNKIDIAKKMQEYLLSSRGDYIFVTDSKGVIIASQGSKLNGSNATENPAIASAIKGQAVTTINDTKHMPFSIISAAPVMSATGDLKGSVLIGYSLYDTNIVDNLKELTGNDFTVFKDDVRINTTFDVNGERQINTKVDEKIAKKVIKKGHTYQHEMNLYGKDRLVIYKPLKDNDENVVGIIFTSKDISSILRSKKSTSYLAIILSIVIFILVAIVIASLIKRLINKPLKKLVVLANKIEDGDIGIGKDDEEITVKYSKDEVGELSKALDSTTRSLKNYMGEITYVLGEIAKGNLTVKSDVEFKGDFVAIKEDLDNIVISLKGTITGINGAAIQVSSGAQQVAGGSQALSQGSTEQASAIEELSASINEISDKIKTNALNAQKATSFGEEAAEGVVNSNKQMQDMVAAMDDINKTANEISKIIKTIDDIAFQTNILALNASVEAARAGTAGKGFAVVANEVRSLAEKSAEAANQTTALIENSIKAVKKGNKIAQQTADSLDSVVDKSKFVMNLVEQISAESNNQSQSVNDISMGVDQISAVVQTNSATAEESAAASEELSSQSVMLQELITKFKID